MISGGLTIPAGVILPFAGGTAPAGWLLCGGQAVSRTNFAALFSAIGVLHGVGDGTTTFNLPDLRGRALFGKDDMNGTAANRLTTGNSGINGALIGESGGSEIVTLTEAQMPSHGHIQRTASAVNIGGNIHTSQLSNSQTAGSLTESLENTNTKGSSAAHQNMPPALVVLMIIKT